MKTTILRTLATGMLALLLAPYAGASGDVDASVSTDNTVGCDTAYFGTERVERMFYPRFHADTEDCDVHASGSLRHVFVARCQPVGTSPGTQQRVGVTDDCDVYAHLLV